MGSGNCPLPNTPPIRECIHNSGMASYWITHHWEMPPPLLPSCNPQLKFCTSQTELQEHIEHVKRALTIFFFFFLIFKAIFAMFLALCENKVSTFSKLKVNFEIEPSLTWSKLRMLLLADNVCCRSFQNLNKRLWYGMVFSCLLRWASRLVKRFVCNAGKIIIKEELTGIFLYLQV